MANLPPPNNDPIVPEDEQAPVAPDGFAPQWIGGQNLNNNNGWIEWDVPLGGEVDEPMVDLEFDEEEMDDDDNDNWDDDVKLLMALVTPPRAIVTISSTYEVGGPSIAAVEGPSFPLPASRLHVPQASKGQNLHALRPNKLCARVRSVDDMPFRTRACIIIYCGPIETEVKHLFGGVVQAMMSSGGSIVASLKNINGFLAVNTLSNDLIYIDFKQEGVVPKVMLHIFEEFVLLLGRHPFNN
nr:hypothetical protein [Tanacetum cinerariifolium]